MVALWHSASLIRLWNDPGANFNLALRTPGSTMLLANGRKDELHGSVKVGFDGHRG